MSFSGDNFYLVLFFIIIEGCVEVMKKVGLGYFVVCCVFVLGDKRFRKEEGIVVVVG